MGQQQADDQRNTEDDENIDEDVNWAEAHFSQNLNRVRVEAAPDGQIQGRHEYGRGGRYGGHTDRNRAITARQIGDYVGKVADAPAVQLCYRAHRLKKIDRYRYNCPTCKKEYVKCPHGHDMIVETRNGYKCAKCGMAYMYPD